MRRIKVTRKTRWATSAGAALLLCVVGGCGASSPNAEAGKNQADEDSQGPVHAVVFGALGAEGILSQNAETSIKSAEAAVAIANEEGGILGRNIELTVVDDNGDPTVAITKLRELLNGDS